MKRHAFLLVVALAFSSSSFAITTPNEEPTATSETPLAQPQVKGASCREASRAGLYGGYIMPAGYATPSKAKSLPKGART
jgi:hypothetical protein